MKLLICYYILLLSEESRKSRNYESWNTECIKKGHKYDWVFNHMKDTFIFLLIDYFICSPLNNLVQDIRYCSNYRCKSEYIANRGLAE